MTCHRFLLASTYRGVKGKGNLTLYSLKHFYQKKYKMNPLFQSDLKPFLAYMTAGDGDLDYQLECTQALVQGGVDILEVGIPFSDPVADGPVIQLAMERALTRGTKPHDVLHLIRQIRKQQSTPIVLFSYYNPILKMGAHFLEEAKELGVDALLIVDAPFDAVPLSKFPLPCIGLISPTTANSRVQAISQVCSPFLYYVAHKGTTGTRAYLPSDFKFHVERIKQASQLPVVAGFGISSRETAAEALEIADGFVVGSYFVEAMGRRIFPERLTELAKEIDPRGNRKG